MPGNGVPLDSTWLLKTVLSTHERKILNPMVNMHVCAHAHSCALYMCAQIVCVFWSKLIK